MPRPSRIEIGGGMHHVTARAPKGLLLFRVRADRTLYLDLLAREVRRRGWSVRTYCLMGNHIHLLVVTPNTDLGEGIKAIHELFVMAMHRRHGSYGPLLKVFKNRIVDTTEHELACLRYIARNPVKDGFCAGPADWEWSAHPALAGLRPAPSFLDVQAVFETISPESYVEYVEMSDANLIDELAGAAPSTWMADAVDIHRVPVVTLASQLELPVSTTYRKLAAAREKKGRLP